MNYISKNTVFWMNNYNGSILKIKVLSNPENDSENNLIQLIQLYSWSDETTIKTHYTFVSAINNWFDHRFLDMDILEE